MRHDCVLPRPRPRADQLAGRPVNLVQLLGGADPGPSLLLSILLKLVEFPDLVIIHCLCFSPILLDMPKDGLLARCDEASKKLLWKRVLGWPNTPSRAYASPGSLASPPNCRPMPKPSQDNWASSCEPTHQTTQDDGEGDLNTGHLDRHLSGSFNLSFISTPPAGLEKSALSHSVEEPSSSGGSTPIEMGRTVKAVATPRLPPAGLLAKRGAASGFPLSAGGL